MRQFLYNYGEILYRWRVEIGIGLLVLWGLWMLGLNIRIYQMMKYLSGGRSWPSRFKLIRDRFMRKRHG